MSLAITLAIWVTLVAGIYLGLSRDLFRCVIGLALIGSGINLLLVFCGRVQLTNPPFVPAGEAALPQAANPLPQALVLTAIVIGFAMVCASLILALRIIRDAKTDDILELRAAEPIPDLPHAPPFPRAVGDDLEVRA